MYSERVVKLGSIKGQIQGYCVGQVLFAVLDSRAKNATVLFVTLAKHVCDSLARRYRNGGEPAVFAQATVRAVRVLGPDEIAVLTPVGAAK